MDLPTYLICLLLDVLNNIVKDKNDTFITETLTHLIHLKDDYEDYTEIYNMISKWYHIYTNKSKPAWDEKAQVNEREIGNRFVPFCILSGPVILILDQLEKIIRENSKDLTVQERKLRILRGFVNGQQIVGLAIPPTLIQEIAIRLAMHKEENANVKLGKTVTEVFCNSHS